MCYFLKLDGRLVCRDEPHTVLFKSFFKRGEFIQAEVDPLLFV